MFRALIRKAAYGAATATITISSTFAHAQQDDQIIALQLDDTGRQVKAKVDLNIDSDEKTITIRPDQTLVDDTRASGLKAKAAGSKWIGVMCSPMSDVLRNHLKMDAGLVLEEIVKPSPANDAELQRHDILVSANNSPLKNVGDLVSAIKSAGEGRLEIEFLRNGEKHSTSVQPTVRNEALLVDVSPVPGAVLDGKMKELIDGLQLKLNGNSLPGGNRLRFIGPGINVRANVRGRAQAGGGAPYSMPQNLSISVQRSGDTPAVIKVQRNNDKWEISENDLDELPDEIRPHVERMLGGQAPGGLDTFGQAIDALDLDLPDFGRMNDRFLEMEERMEEMFQRMQQFNGKTPGQGIQIQEQQPEQKSKSIQLDDKDARYVTMSRQCA